ncbi:hypothetical protein JN531_013050 [Flagellatimonas centrodinii]|uniref:hypothetical protein n=1 Tax=Flagellatimonas centrodinii TaxID=2806210 RepID=UPI001FEE2DFA|nr:hypothetical protein [Flagellatimonas centrodinii]ULQ46025.1 hypothetical protein JN531_013050 [Flagellatimonas centrodinii]
MNEEVVVRRRGVRPWMFHGLIALWLVSAAITGHLPAALAAGAFYVALVVAQRFAPRSWWEPNSRTGNVITYALAVMLIIVIAAVWWSHGV